MVIISRISRGTIMDQIYLPKIRPPGFSIGDYVEIAPTKKEKRPFYTCHVPYLEPIKDKIREEIFDYFEAVDNVIISGSFVEKGWRFNDIDVIVVGPRSVDKSWQAYFQQRFGLTVHFIALDRNSLMKGLRQDPLFQMMLSKYLAKKREIFMFKNEYNYKILDLHLLQSKTLSDNFDFLTGREKCKMVRNVCAIRLFLQKKTVHKEAIDKEIDGIFGKGSLTLLQENMAEKRTFCNKFKKLYEQTFQEIMKYAPKPK